MEITDSDSAVEAMVGRLAALASEHRLAVFKALVRSGHKGMSADLVHDERQGRSIIYRANFAAMESLVRYLFEECCAEGCDLPTRSAEEGIEA